MTSTYTQMPLYEEFIRAIVTQNDDGSIAIQLTSMSSFRAKIDDFQKLMRASTQELVNVYENNPENDSLAQHSYNYYLNLGIAKLEEEGKLIRGKSSDQGSLNQTADILEGRCFIYTDDNYISFNPTKLPFTPSPYRH